VAAEDGRIVEKTERRVRSYRFVIDDDETLLWLLAQTPSGDLCLEEVEDVPRFSRKFYGVPAEGLDRIDRIMARQARSRRWGMVGPARGPGKRPDSGPVEGWS
jgi:hypothetical protein